MNKQSRLNEVREQLLDCCHHLDILRRGYEHKPDSLNPHFDRIMEIEADMDFLGDEEIALLKDLKECSKK